MSEIKLFQGDCLEVMKIIPSKTITCTVTSPPYDNLRVYNGNINQWCFEKFQEIANELYRITKDGGVVVWVVNDATIKGSETGSSFKQALYFKELGFNLHDTMIWHKPTVPYDPKCNRYWQTVYHKTCPPIALNFACFILFTQKTHAFPIKLHIFLHAFPIVRLNID